MNSASTHTIVRHDRPKPASGWDAPVSIAMWIVMLLALLVCGAVPPNAGADEMDDLKAEIRALKRRVSELEQRLEERERAEKEGAEIEVVEPKPAEPEVEVAEAEPEEAEAAEEPAPWKKDAEEVPFERRTVQIRARDIGISIGGYVKVDFIKDFDFVGDEDAFVTADIPVRGTPDAEKSGRTTAHARQTRLNLDITGPTPVGPSKAFVEGDFFGSGTTLRLRHAYFSVDRLLAGQTWTTFSDVSALPTTVDFEAPPSEITTRQALIRWTQPLRDDLEVAVALEEPDSDVTPPDPEGSSRTAAPDGTAWVRYERPWGHVQLAGLLRQIGTENRTGRNDDVLGWGVSLSARARLVRRVGLRRLLPERLWKDNSLMFQVAGGEGIGRYLQDLGGTGSDAGPSATGDLQALPAIGTYAGYEHWWTQNLWSVATYGYVWVDNSTGQPDSAYHSTQYASANLIWNIYPRVYLGMEFLYGLRENKDGRHGHARRFQFSTLYDFQ
jgi:hypothetical protein